MTKLLRHQYSGYYNVIARYYINIMSYKRLFHVITKLLLIFTNLFRKVITRYYTNLLQRFLMLLHVIIFSRY